MIRLHMNESPYPPSRAVLEYVSRYAERINVYSVEELSEELLGGLERYAGLPREHIDFYPGSSHALTLMVALARVRGLSIVMPHPTFHALYPLIRGFGVDLRPLRLGEGFELDEQRLLREAEGRLVYLANPNNPTGNMLVRDPDYVLKLSRVAEYVFVDEAYYEFSGFTVKDLVLECDNVAVLRSLSKAFSIAGARFGYVLAGRRVRRDLRSLRVGFETPVITQAAALGALRDRAYAERVVAEIRATREYTRAKLLERGLRSFPSETNFLLVDLGRPCGATWSKLRERGVLTLCLERVEDLSREYGNYLRVTIGRRNDMDYFIESLAELL